MVAQSMSTMDMALKRCARNCRNTYSFAARGQPTRISSESTAMRAQAGDMYRTDETWRSPLPNRPLIEMLFQAHWMYTND